MVESSTRGTWLTLECLVSTKRSHILNKPAAVNWSLKVCACIVSVLILVSNYENAWEEKDDRYSNPTAL